VDQLFARLRATSSARTLRQRLKLILTSVRVAAPTCEELLRHPALQQPDPDQLRQWQPLAATAIDAASAEFARDAALPPTQAAAAEAVRHIRRLLDDYGLTCRRRSAILQALAGGDAEGANRLLRDTLRELYLARITINPDYHATGDQVVHQVALLVPPGHHARVLGCQNIKGTGLDFAYRWVSLGKVDEALQRLHTEPAARGATLSWLAAHSDYGLVDCRWALHAVQELLQQGAEEWTPQREQLQALATQLSALAEQKQKLLGGAPKRGLLRHLLAAMEPWVDHLDSIRRQRRAIRIMQDLFNQRVGQGRAAQLLREVTARGKGGWLAKDVEKWWKRRAAK
jgi:antitoxin component HigA of HigAB toxin-antitoxin module